MIGKRSRKTRIFVTVSENNPHGQQVAHPTKLTNKEWKKSIFVTHRIKAMNVSCDAVYGDSYARFNLFSSRFSFSVFAAFFFTSLLAS